jgi:hypothetical protein
MDNKFHVTMILMIIKRLDKMQNESSTINSVLEVSEYTQATISQKLKPFHSEEIGLIIDELFHAPQENRVDVSVDITGIRKYSSRGKLYKIKRKA